MVWRPKPGQNWQTGTLQSPDDLEATFRKKRGEGHVGYVVNVTETVDEGQGLQLITKVQTESNTADDAKMLDEALPDLVERTELETLYTDGTYSSPAVDTTCQEQGVNANPEWYSRYATRPEWGFFVEFRLPTGRTGHT